MVEAISRWAFEEGCWLHAILCHYPSSSFVLFCTDDDDPYRFHVASYVSALLWQSSSVQTMMIVISSLRWDFPVLTHTMLSGEYAPWCLTKQQDERSQSHLWTAAMRRSNHMRIVPTVRPVAGLFATVQSSSRVRGVWPTISPIYVSRVTRSFRF